MNKNDEQARQAFGKHIAEVRKQHGITQAELAARIGWLSQSHIARIEAGKYSTGLDHLMAIAEAMGMKLEFVKQ